MPFLLLFISLEGPSAPTLGNNVLIAPPYMEAGERPATPHRRSACPCETASVRVSGAGGTFLKCTSRAYPHVAGGERRGLASQTCGNPNLKPPDAHRWREFTAEENPPPSPARCGRCSSRAILVGKTRCLSLNPNLPATPIQARPAPCGLGEKPDYAFHPLWSLHPPHPRHLLQVPQRLGSGRPDVGKLRSAPPE